MANVLISQFKGQVVLDDFGCYAREHHTALIREELLMLGVYTLSELPEKLRDRALLVRKMGRDARFRMRRCWPSTRDAA